MSLIENAMSRRGSRVARSTPSSVRQRPIGKELSVNLEGVNRFTPDEEDAFANRLNLDAPDKTVVNAYKMLRTQVVTRLKANNWSTIGVTAAGPGEGKTLTAANLALSLAKIPGQRVFLIDFDLRRHSLSRYLGLEDQAMLMPALRGETPIESAFTQYGEDSLYVLANNEKLELSSEMLGSEKVRQLVHTVQGLGGLVIFDLPPLLSVDDYLAFSESIDCTLFVVSQGESSRSSVARAGELLDSSRLLGVVLNKSQEAASADPYYYS